MLATLIVATQHAWVAPSCPLASTTPSWRAASPRLAAGESEAERQDRLKQLFGDDFKDKEAKELARTTTVVQPKRPEPMPEWMEPQPEGVSSLRDWEVERVTLWLEASGVNTDKVLVVRDGGVAV